MNTPPELALYSAAQVRGLDRSAIESHGVAGYELMTRAGAAAHAELARRWPGARRIAVVCGGGNNGGDGYVVARLARADGREVTLLHLGDPDRLRGDAATAADDWRACGGEILPFAQPALEGADVVVDALLGTGLERPVEGAWADAVRAINDAGAEVLALDVPSGLDAGRGVPLGCAVRAATTVTFVGQKPGLFTAEGPDYAGEVRFARLDLPDGVYAGVEPVAALLDDRDLARRLPRRRRNSHKGDHGRVLVVGGDAGMAGAVLLAGSAALRTGAGLVTVATRPGHASALTAARPELMCHGVGSAADLRPLLRRADVVAIGPGLGRGAWGLDLLGATLDSGRPLVVDADALTLLAGDPLRRDDWILTPHPGEAARLLGRSTAEVQSDRLAAAAELQSRWGGVAILKGAGSMVADGPAPPGVCREGNPGMAAGGFGDLLTGIVAALRAQGLAARDAARAGVLIHARAGDLAAREGERGLLPSDALEHLRGRVNPA
ncbi:MAG: NAD(P)H-hydrate dehydratase [Gammaproteobacteria bacterium]|nr:NAD(P)H-hydrate dehydratase [Gammaproteobacteria bacterium]